MKDCAQFAGNIVMVPANCPQWVLIECCTSSQGPFDGEMGLWWHGVNWTGCPKPQNHRCTLRILWERPRRRKVALAFVLTEPLKRWRHQR